jgi:hypothetical protein
MLLIRRGIFLVFGLLVPVSALAWGEKGHRIVGELAQHQLSPAAQAEVARLLADEPEPTLAGVSKWADEVRENDPERGKRTAPWHYVNYPRNDCHFTPPRDCPNGDCAVGAINRFFLALSDRQRSDDERREALKFLVHFVGDLHQPLHNGYRDDRGGNEYQINYDGEGMDLHDVWDWAILDSRDLSARDYADWLQGQSPLPYDPSRRSDRPAVDWARESCDLVQQGDLYPRGHIIDRKYVEHQRPLAERRLRQAGARLAAMLNYALAAPATRR